MKRKLLGFAVIALSLCMMTGCFLKTGRSGAKNVFDGDIECEFRVGKDAKVMRDAIDTDVVFDKNEFTELLDEAAQYNPTSLKYHTDKCDLKINAQDQPEEWEEIFYSEINIKAVSGRQSKNVSVYELDSKLYFFVLSMGGNSKPEEEGYYFMELSGDMSKYWYPILKEVREDAVQDHWEKYGSFTIERAYSYDRAYFTQMIDSGANVMIIINDKHHNVVCSFTPCRKSDFWGVCWENDNYNLWIQSGDIGTVCYSMEGGKWVLNEDAVRPDYIVSKYDG